MHRTRSGFVVIGLLTLALLPVVAAMSMPSTDQRRRALTEPLTAVSESFGRSVSTDTPADLVVITVVGAGLLGLAAVVRKSGTSDAGQ